MKRRNFLKMGSTVSAGMGLLGTHSFYRNIFNIESFSALNNTSNNNILIIIRLNGGNDGLNTLIPLHDYDEYKYIRSTVALNKNSLLKLHDYTSIEDRINLALHPSMGGFKELYDAGKLCIIRAVGYDHPDYSHFGSTNIMFRGDGGNENNPSQNGWVGRYMHHAHVISSSYNGSELMSGADPMAITLGTKNPSSIFEHPHGEQTNNQPSYGAGTAEYNADYLTDDFVPNTSQSRHFVSTTQYQNLLAYINQISIELDIYRGRVSQAYSTGTSVHGDESMYASGNNSSLQRQLRVISRLIKGGITTKVFMVNHVGYDTHAQQVNASNTTGSGKHETLLSELSNSVSKFMADMNANGLGDRVVLATFSEFGRTPVPNASLGTDHGNISPMFVIGNKVNGGIIGNTTDLHNLNGRIFYNNAKQYDYRQVYSTLLQDWLGASTGVVSAMDFNFSKLNIIKSNDCQFFPVKETTLTFMTNDQGYYYFQSNTSTYYNVGIKFYGNIVPNSADIVVTMNTLDCQGSNPKIFKKTANNGNGIFVNGTYLTIMMKNSADFKIESIRWFGVDNTDMNHAATAHSNQYPGTTKLLNENIYFYARGGKLSMPIDIKDDATGFSRDIRPMKKTTGTYSGNAYIQLKESIVDIQHDYTPVSSTNILSIGVFRSVLKIQELQPDPQPGMLRYHNGRIQGYTKKGWVYLGMK